MLIPINKKTIRPNPQAGQTVFHIPGRQEVTETVIQDGIKSVYSLYQDKKLLIAQETCSEPNSIAKNVSQDIQTLCTLSPQSKYLYEYEETNVVCKYCEWTGKVDELEGEYRYFEDYCESNDTICPNCKEWNCCEYQYEKLSDKELEKFVNHD